MNEEKASMKKKAWAFILTVVMIFAGTIPALAQTGAEESVTAEYSDTSSHWAREAINKVAGESRSIFADKDNKFEPDKPITRREFALLLHRALYTKTPYIKPDISEIYNDVKSEDTVVYALYRLAAAGIIDYKVSFEPDKALARDDMIHFVINSLEYMTGGDYAMIQIYPEPFADASDINPAYKDDFVKAQVFKLVNGAGNSRFLPKSSATRAEAAAVVYRLKNLLQSLKPGEKVQITPLAVLRSDSIYMYLTIANKTENAFFINHSSGQRYDFELLDADRKVLYRWSADKVFKAESSSTFLEPRETSGYEETVQREDFMDKAVYMKIYIAGTSEDFTINSEGYEITIVESDATIIHW